ncbi:hypothetical protein Q3G72_025391 [Acer saccharum]|nr:hypothetical protein Q3G72_025391 [Acer saccharum]
MKKIYELSIKCPKIPERNKRRQREKKQDDRGGVERQVGEEGAREVQRRRHHRRLEEAGGGSDWYPSRQDPYPEVLIPYLGNRYYNKDGILEDVAGPTLLVISWIPINTCALCIMYADEKSGLCLIYRQRHGYGDWIVVLNISYLKLWSIANLTALDNWSIFMFNAFGAICSLRTVTQMYLMAHRLSCIYVHIISFGFSRVASVGCMSPINKL